MQAEQGLRAAVAGALRAAGFTVRETSSGRTASAALSRFRPDLVVLDLDLPDADGLAFAARLAETLPRTPAILLTTRAEPRDRLAGLAVADDYVTAPFSATEIAARVRAVLRRTRRGQDGVLRFADVVLDELRHEASRAGRALRLSPLEFSLLRFFLRNPERVLTRDEIAANVWDDRRHGSDAAVETYVSYLRRKLDLLGPPLLRTVRLVGYVLREPSP